MIKTKHWKQFRPKMYAVLVKDGLLQQAAEQAALLTEDALETQLKRNMNHQWAWETVREEYLLLPSEADLPVLDENPEGLPPALWNASQSFLYTRSTTDPNDASGECRFTDAPEKSHHEERKK